VEWVRALRARSILRLMDVRARASGLCQRSLATTTTATMRMHMHTPRTPRASTLTVGVWRCGCVAAGDSEAWPAPTDRPRPLTPHDAFIATLKAPPTTATSPHSAHGWEVYSAGIDGESRESRESRSRSATHTPNTLSPGMPSWQSESIPPSPFPPNCLLANFRCAPTVASCTVCYPAPNLPPTPDHNHR
jgi:hypothetical protein